MPGSLGHLSSREAREQTALGLDVIITGHGASAAPEPDESVSFGRKRGAPCSHTGHARASLYSPSRRANSAFDRRCPTDHRTLGIGGKAYGLDHVPW